MANPEHLAILKQGVEVWNEWRERTKFTKPDLAGLSAYHANLSHVDFRVCELSEAQLSEANLHKADLSGAILNGACLHEANLNRAHAEGAEFQGADLSRAILSRTNLDNTDLRKACLWGAFLNGASVKGANLEGATIGETVFADCDLSTSIGLDTLKHASRSFIDVPGFFELHSKLPLNFLQEVGIPEPVITFASSLIAAGHAIQWYSCFISHSTADKAFADRLHADLQAKGVRCWFAPEDLKIGDPFRQRIDESILLHDKLLLILSEHSVASAWVQDEVEAALERERREKRLVLFPIRIDDAVMETEQAWAASIRRTRHIGDFSNWKDHDSSQKAFQRLLKDLKADGEKGG